MSHTVPALLILLAVAALLVFASVLTAGGPVPLASAQRFARNYSLTLNDTNGPSVVRALATMHRWRRFGLACGFAFGALSALFEGQLNINFTTMFLGWFAGAVVAQWRINAPVSGARRSASLTPRTVRDYLSGFAWGALCVTLALVAAGVLGAGIAAAGQPSLRLDWAVGAAEAALGCALMAAAARRVLARGRPSETVLAEADDALRKHSLAVIVGSAIALASVPLGNFWTIVAQVVLPDPTSEGGLVSLGWLLVLLACVLTGLSIGRTAPRP